MVTLAFNAGNGLVVITPPSVPSIPEPASFVLLASGLAGLLMLRQRRAL